MIMAAAFAYFVTPIILLLAYPRRWARLGLGLVWVVSGILGARNLVMAERARLDMDTLDSYPLSGTAGSHQVEVARLSQGSMEAWVHAEATPPPIEDLRKLHWSAPQGLSVDWFGKPARYDTNPPSSVFLFQVHRPVEPNRLVFQYVCDPEQAGLLRSCSLLVRHDLYAMDALAVQVAGPSLLGQALLGWGVLWLFTQAVLEVRLRLKKQTKPIETP
jgi:hypothetical protein